MAVISANISFKRGGHELLDASSKYTTYSEALNWAKRSSSNACVGQYIYIEQDELISTVSEPLKTYSKGAYVVEAIGEHAVITPLSKSIAGAEDLAGEVSSVKQDVNILKPEVELLNQKTNQLESDLSLKADKTEIENLATKEMLANSCKVLDVIVDGVSVLHEDKKAFIDLSGKADKSDIHQYSLIQKEMADSRFAAQYEFRQDGLLITTINIPKDQFLKSAEYIQSATEEDKRIGGDAVEIGRAYLKFVWLVEGHAPTYVPAGSIASQYNGSSFITISDGNTIELNMPELTGSLNGLYLQKSEFNGFDSKVTANTNKLVDVEKTVGATIDQKIDAYKKIVDAAYKAIEVPLKAWDDDSLDEEIRAVQARALKAKFGDMHKYINFTFGIEKVSQLPTVNISTNKIYLLVQPDNLEVEEYIRVNDQWLKLGTAAGGYSKSEINKMLEDVKSISDKTYVKIQDSITTEEIDKITNPVA